MYVQSISVFTLMIMQTNMYIWIWFARFIWMIHLNEIHKIHIWDKFVDIEKHSNTETQTENPFWKICVYAKLFTYVYIYIYLYIMMTFRHQPNVRSHTNTHEHIHMHTRAHEHTNMHTHKHIHTYSHTHTCAYTHKITHTHAHTCTHTHTLEVFLRKDTFYSSRQRKEQYLGRRTRQGGVQC